MLANAFLGPMGLIPFWFWARSPPNTRSIEMPFRSVRAQVRTHVETKFVERLFDDRRMARSREREAIATVPKRNDINSFCANHGRPSRIKRTGTQHHCPTYNTGSLHYQVFEGHVRITMRPLCGPLHLCGVCVLSPEKGIQDMRFAQKSLMVRPVPRRGDLGIAIRKSRPQCCSAPELHYNDSTRQSIPSV